MKWQPQSRTSSCALALTAMSLTSSRFTAAATARRCWGGLEHSASSVRCVLLVRVHGWGGDVSQHQATKKVIVTM